MSFSSDETSIQGSRPIELYAFTLGGTLVSLTDASTEQVLTPRTYLPAAIGRNQPTYSAEKPASELTIEVAIGDENAAPLVAAFIPRPPAGLSQVAITQRQPTGDRAFWAGFVTGSNYSGGILKMLCRPLSDIISKTGPRRGFGLLCQHTLFDSRCSLNENLYDQIGTVTAISVDGLTFTVSGISAPTVRFDTGQIQLSGDFAQGMVVAYSGSDFTVRYPIPEIEIGSVVRVVEGCKRDTADCTSYGNIVNYGGYPYTPTDVNPFEKGLDKA